MSYKYDFFNTSEVLESVLFILYMVFWNRRKSRVQYYPPFFAIYIGNCSDKQKSVLLFRIAFFKTNLGTIYMYLRPSSPVHVLEFNMMNNFEQIIYEI